MSQKIGFLEERENIINEEEKAKKPEVKKEKLVKNRFSDILAPGNF